MLTLTDVLGGMDDGTPEEVRALLMDLVNADDEHPDVSFANEAGIGVSVFSDFRVIIYDMEEDSFSPMSLRASGPDQIVEIAHLLDQGQHNQILARYGWTEGYSPAN